MQITKKEGGYIVEGYAAKFDETTDLGKFRERIQRGAFKNVLDNDVRFLLNHDGLTLARTTNGTLKLREDATGLHYTAELNDTTAGRDLYAAIKRGDISQSSFAFTIDRQSWSDDNSTRTVEQVGRLLDVSAVVYPAYENSSVKAL
jgi:hypothetical protein